MTVHSLDLQQLCPAGERDRERAGRQKRLQSQRKSGSWGSSHRMVSRRHRPPLQRGGNRRSTKPGAELEPGYGAPLTQGTDRLSFMEYLTPAAGQQAKMPHRVEGRVTDSPESCQEVARPRATTHSTDQTGQVTERPQQGQACVPRPCAMCVQLSWVTGQTRDGGWMPKKG